MTKLLMPIFNFNFAKIFLEIIQEKVYNNGLEDNMFSHSSNPLLQMTHLYALLNSITSKFYSLNNACRAI